MALAKQRKTNPKRWSLFGLRRAEGFVKAKSIVLIREVGGSAVRLWFQNYLDDQEWTRMEHLEWDDGVLRIEFPSDEFFGLPGCLLLEIPKHETLGGIWTLRLPDGAVAETFELARINEISTAALSDLEDSYRTRQRE